MNRTCFCCDKELTLDHDTEIKESSNYNDATCWTSGGAWCSKVFDGLMDKFLKLEIVICDECLKKKINTAYGWENIKIFKDEPLDLGLGRKVPIIKEQRCGRFGKYEK